MMQYKFVMFQTQVMSLLTFRFTINTQNHSALFRILVVGKIWEGRQTPPSVTGTSGLLPCAPVVVVVVAAVVVVYFKHLN